MHYESVQLCTCACILSDAPALLYFRSPWTLGRVYASDTRRRVDDKCTNWGRSTLSHVYAMRYTDTKCMNYAESQEKKTQKKLKCLRYRIRTLGNGANIADFKL